MNNTTPENEFNLQPEGTPLASTTTPAKRSVQPLAILAVVAMLAAALGAGWFIGNRSNGETTVATETSGTESTNDANTDSSNDDDTEADATEADGSDDDVADESDPTNDEPTSMAPIPVPGSLPSTLEGASDSVVQILATGEFASLDGVATEGVGAGSGVIISEEGVVVTNNHVVAGAAFLEVLVPGDDRPRSARVLATSECNDLAVIDIEGDGFPVLPFTMEPTRVGTTVFAAGYPLGDPEFTLTRGIISKQSARGDTIFSSVRSVLEHDSNINPGNSGGPLLNESGQIVGINYQSNSSNQYFAISAPEAFPVIERMVAGESVDSIGFNGQVVQFENNFGIFVSSVETGGIAESAGVLAGDVLLEIERIDVSTDGTMKAFCETLRTNGQDAELELSLIRPSTGEVLRGKLNGSEPLAVTFNGNEVMSASGMSTSSDQVPMGGPTMRLTDETGIVTVEIPAAWADVDGAALTVSDSDIVVPSLTASPDLDGFRTTFDVAGVEILAVNPDQLSFDGLWSAFDNLTASCDTVNPVEPGSLGEATGSFQSASDCGSSNATLILLQVQDPSSGFFLRVTLQLLDAEDFDAAELILASVNLKPVSQTSYLISLFDLVALSRWVSATGRFQPPWTWRPRG